MMIQLPQYVLDGIAGRPYIIGVDLYHNSQVDSLHEAAAAGVEFAFLKMGEAIDIRDPLYTEFSDRCDEVGIVNGGYWFTHADMDPILQAGIATGCARRWRTTAERPGNLILGMDTETLNGQRAGIVGAHAKAFEDIMREKTGRGAIVYSSQSFAEECLRPYLFDDVTYWIARYGAWPTIPAKFVQIADGENLIIDIPGLGQPVDVNIFLGTRQELIDNYTYH